MENSRFKLDVKKHNKNHKNWYRKHLKSIQKVAIHLLLSSKFIIKKKLLKKKKRKEMKLLEHYNLLCLK
jgi:LEA14-like dessication related protein